MQNIQTKEAVLLQVQRVVNKSKKISQEQQEETIDEVKSLEENFQKVIGFAQFLLENCRKFSDSVGEQQARNMQLEHNSEMMKEQVMFMQDDWKRE